MDYNHRVCYFDSERQSHELLTFGGLVSPLRAVADDMLQNLSEETLLQDMLKNLHTIVSDATALLRQIIGQGNKQAANR